MRKFLFFERLKRAALLSLLVCVAGTAKSLAQTQVATLQHGEETTAFYGADAFVDAHEAAVDGDIITLSSGNFWTTEITKGITLRGAGVAVDTVAGTLPTVFDGNIELYVENDTIPLQVEGIKFTGTVTYDILYSPKFTRCSFQEIHHNSQHYYYMYDAVFTNCIISYFYFYQTNNTSLFNSVVWNAYHSDTRTVLLYNSIMKPENAFSRLTAYNSIMLNSKNHSSSCMFYNCLGVTTNSTSPFGDGYTTGCVIYNSFNDVFENYSFSLDDPMPFVLKEAVATGFLGNDGTQVGIYGGAMPYQTRPTFMVPVNYIVPGQSTIDGQLNIEVEIIDGE